MKVVEERIRAFLLKTAGFVLAALLCGRFIVGPLADRLQGNVRDFVLGTGLIAAGCVAVNGFVAMRINRQSLQSIEQRFPQDLEAVRRIGVETPLDFSFMMGAELTYLRYSALFPIPTMMLSGNLRILRKSREMFRELFGREPIGGASGDWDEITEKEAAAMLHREGKQISQDEMMSQVSDRVKQYYKNQDSKEA